MFGGLDPLNPDTDGDGLADGDPFGDNIKIFQGGENGGWSNRLDTLPLNPDSDHDSIPDGFEFENNFEPLYSSSDRINTVILVPDDGGYIQIPYMHGTRLVVMLLNVVSSSASEQLIESRPYLLDAYGAPLLHRGMNAIIIPENVFYQHFDITPESGLSTDAVNDADDPLNKEFSDLILDPDVDDYKIKWHVMTNQTGEGEDLPQGLGIIVVTGTTSGIQLADFLCGFLKEEHEEFAFELYEFYFPSDGYDYKQDLDDVTISEELERYLSWNGYTLTDQAQITKLVDSWEITDGEMKLVVREVTEGVLRAYLDYRQDFEDLTVTQQLIDVFGDNGFHITEEDAQIKWKGDHWEITEEDLTLLIKEETGEVLNVYKQTKQMGIRIEDELKCLGLGFLNENSLVPAIESWGCLDGLSYLTEKYNEYKKGAENFGNKVGEKAIEVGEAFVEFAEETQEFIGDLGEKVVEVVSEVGTILITPIMEIAEDIKDALDIVGDWLYEAAETLVEYAEVFAVAISNAVCWFMDSAWNLITGIIDTALKPVLKPYEEMEEEWANGLEAIANDFPQWFPSSRGESQNESFMKETVRTDSRGSSVEDLVKYLTGGSFFFFWLTIVTAIVVVAGIASAFFYHPPALAIAAGGCGDKLALLILTRIAMTMGLSIMTAGAASIGYAILETVKTVVPDADEFWASDIGLGSYSIIESLAMLYLFPKSLKSLVKDCDILGLIFCFVGLAISFSFDGIFWAESLAFGLVTLGFGLTLGKGISDKLIAPPLNYIEEIIGGFEYFYQLTDWTATLAGW